MSTVQQPAGSRWDEALARKRQPLSIALLVVGALLFVEVVVLFLRYKWDYAPVWAGSFLFALGALGAGVWLRQEAAAPGGLSGRDSARLLVLVLGGLLGFALTVGGLWQTIYWWKDVIGGTQTWQGEHGWHLWVLSGVNLAGLAVMFFSLLLARGEETDNPTLRYLLYGYNAVLTALLLLGILVILNILGYLYLPPSSDWTEAGIYTLSSQSENVLKGLDRPVRVYVLTEDRATQFAAETHDLLDNARALTDKLQVDYLVRDLNVEDVDRLSRQYNLPDAVGMLVVYGSGDQEAYSFIKREDMYQQPRGMDPDNPRRGPSFKGEDALVSTLLFLEEGKKKPVVYFLQGEGELDLFGALEGGKPDRTARTLLDRLEKQHYEVKGLRLGANLGKSDDARVVVAEGVPDDAQAVVIAGPREKFEPKALDALRKYMTVPRKEKDPADPKKEKEREVKGKLFVLMDVVPGSGDRMFSTGLEPVLGDFDVDVGNERILRPIEGGRPEQVLVMTNPELRERNPLAANITDPLWMTDVRPVQPRSPSPRPGEPPPMSRYQADRLMVTAPPLLQRTPVWAEADLRPPQQVIAEYVDKRQDELRGKLRGTITMAVAVSDPAAPDPMDPHAGLRGRGGDGTPRMIVIGNARFASDAALAGGAAREAAGGGNLYYELFANGLAWLRERPSSIGISPKERNIYKMKEGTNVDRMVTAPFVLMALGIVGLGLGVWVVRRR
jgi:hypothetical protein